MVEVGAIHASSGTPFAKSVPSPGLTRGETSLLTKALTEKVPAKNGAGWPSGAVARGSGPSSWLTQVGKPSFVDVLTGRIFAGEAFIRRDVLTRGRSLRPKVVLRSR